jgi:hypothetical protein
LSSNKKGKKIVNSLKENMMKHYRSMIGLGLTAAFLTSCLGPQTYFSEVFNTLYDTYFPTQDSQDRLDMNYSVIAEITQDEDVFTFEVDFFTTGLKLIQVGPAVVNGVETTRTLEVVYDYAEDGLFATRTFANTPGEIDKVFEAFDDESFDLFNDAVSVVETTFTDDIKGIINNQATNLIIGGQPAGQAVKNYTLPVAQFVDLATFEDVAGFVPSTLSVKVSLTQATLAATFEITASSPDESYSAELTLFNPGTVNAADYLLSANEKATYDGYVA